MNPNIPGDTHIYYSYLQHIVLQWLRKIQHSEKEGYDLVHYKYPFTEIVPSFNALLSFTYTQNRHAVCATDGATKNSRYDSTQHILTFNIYLALESQRRERQYLQTLQY